ncbi:MAG: hypothetical protein RLY70_3511, partial [Planctomycetota bacterium]
LNGFIQVAANSGEETHTPAIGKACAPRDHPGSCRTVTD